MGGLEIVMLAMVVCVISFGCCLCCCKYKGEFREALGRRPANQTPPVRQGAERRHRQPRRATSTPSRNGDIYVISMDDNRDGPPPEYKCEDELYDLPPTYEEAMNSYGENAAASQVIITQP